MNYCVADRGKEFFNPGNNIRHKQMCPVENGKNLKKKIINKMGHIRCFTTKQTAWKITLNFFLYPMYRKIQRP